MRPSWRLPSGNLFDDVYDVTRGVRPGQALCGARQVIAESLPSLAISVYHKPDHLWRIPQLLASWPELQSYRFYLRSHGFNGFDTVLYATPERPSGSRTSTEVRS